MTERETCDECCGTGVSGHPDSGYTCYKCNGSGGIETTQRSNTAMTMPKKLWIAPWWWETKLQNAVRRKNEDREDDVLYIRSDIADELALALVAMFNLEQSADQMYDEQIGRAALARYNAATEGT